jgi:two-component system response regulator HydG
MTLARRQPVVRSATSARAFALAEQYAPAASTLVIVGGTGTGKSHLASWVHAIGPRATHPFVGCSALELSESLAQAQLFGHERGAFTGAISRSAGLFEQAGDGTLLLDDFHLMPVVVQAVLLRALSSGLYRLVQGTRDLRIRCRVIVGLSQHPDVLMQKGTLLADLRYRLGQCVIALAPLAERREEIAPLAEGFLEEARAATGVIGPKALAPDVLPVLEAAPWPGNARELRSAIEAAYLHARGDTLIRFEHLPEYLQVPLKFEPYGDPETNARAIEWALHRTRNRVEKAARLIGAHRNTVSSHLSQRQHLWNRTDPHNSSRRSVRTSGRGPAFE